MADKVVRSADVLADLAKIDAIRAAVANDPAVAEQIAGVLTKSYPTPAFVQDKLLYQVAVAGLVIVLFACVLGSILLSLNNVAIPDLLATVAGATIGGLVGLFALSPAQKG